jgi:hypothetical protein
MNTYNSIEKKKKHKNESTFIAFSFSGTDEVYEGDNRAVKGGKQSVEQTETNRRFRFPH